MTEILNWEGYTFRSMDVAEPLRRMTAGLTKPLESLSSTIDGAPFRPDTVLFAYLEQSMHAAVHSPAWWNHSTDHLVAAITTYGEEETSSLNAALERFATFGQLADDWDGYGGVKPTLPSMFMALATLLAVWRAGSLSNNAHLDVIPVPTGGVQLEWQGQNGDIEIEVDQDGMMSWLIEWNDGTYDESPSDPLPSFGRFIEQVTRVVS